jgi:pilus assembly protein Flp/PilA
LIAIRTAFRTLRADQRGATAIEYALIAALIAVALISALRQLGGGSGGMWTNLSTTINGSM